MTLYILAGLAGASAAWLIAKGWQRLRNGRSPRNRYPEYRPRR